MTTISEALSRAVEHHRSGQLQQADRIYGDILRIDPAQPDALHLRGVVAHQVGEHTKAIDLITEAIAAQPNTAEFHFNLGTVLRTTEKTDLAVDCFQRAIELRSDYADAHNSLGIALKTVGRIDEAVDSYRSALKIHPRYDEAHNNLGNSLKLQRQFDEALECFNRAIEINPQYAAAYNNRAVLLQMLGRFAEATRDYRRAIEIKPDYCEAYCNWGVAFTEVGLLDDAMDSYSQAIQLNPHDANIYNNLGNTLKQQGEVADAVTAYRQALQLRPSNPKAHTGLLNCLMLDPSVDLDEIFGEHRCWAEQHTGRITAFNNFPNDPNPNRKLKIGYVSPDFCEHPVGHFIESILQEHTRDDVEIVCYSDVATPDDITERLRTLPLRWVELTELTNDDLTDRIRTDRIDILVDLAGHTDRNRLMVFAHKPAPIQVSWLGYPNTTGLTTIDYRFTDHVADPDGEPLCYTEQLVRLPRGFSCYKPPDDVPSVSTLPALKSGKITFGSLHNLGRLNERVIDVWCKILKAVPSSRLLIFRNTLRGQTAARLVDRFEQRGITRERLELRSQVETGQSHWNAYSEIDISLDTFPWSGHTTACESLWMGVPMVTLRGRSHAGRMVASVLTQVGLPDWIANDEQQFVQRAVQQASDVALLSQKRSELRNQMVNSPLCDGVRFTQSLENCYRKMWQCWCSDQP